MPLGALVFSSVVGDVAEGGGVAGFVLTAFWQPANVIEHTPNSTRQIASFFIGEPLSEKQTVTCRTQVQSCFARS